MAIGKRLKSLVERLRPDEGPPSPWRPSGAPYPMLATLDPIAAGIGADPGLIAIWHLGVRPQWLKVAVAMNMQTAIRSASTTQAFLSFRPNGGVYVAWAPLAANSAHAPARFLVERLQPALQSVQLAAEPPALSGAKPVIFPFPPGTTE
jgi:hypothetical protein